MKTKLNQNNKIESIKYLSNIFKSMIEKKNITLFKNIILLLILNYIPFFLSREIRLEKLNYIEEINMKVKSPKDETIIYVLNKKFQISYEIQSNGNSIEYVINNGYILGKGEFNIKLIFDSKVKNCESMFQSCSYIINLDLSNFDTSYCTDMSNMFNGCSKLTSINLNNFKTSSVIKMKNMFNKCSLLRKLDLSSFDTSSVEDMSSMFNECSEIKSIDLGNFKTSSVTTFNSMFNNCFELRLLDLSGFDTSKVTDLNNMFKTCNKLISLDLSNWNTSNVNTMVYTFSACNKLVSLNLIHFDLGNVKGTSNTFFMTNNKLIYYLNAEINNLDEDTFNQWVNQIGPLPSYPNDCFKGSKNKFVIFSGSKPGICILECNYEDYNYEYYSECLKTCPEGTKKSSTNEYLCIDILQCDHFYNYDQTECIDELEDGYYIRDNDNKIIDKCQIKCNKCNFESVQNDSCIECNTEKNYYEIYNEDNKYIDCSNELIEGFYFEDNKYMPCFSHCIKCYGKGDENNNNCSECIFGYKLIGNNCYKECKYFYYFDDKNNYICTDNEQCPENYKLIRNKKKCIDNCANDDKNIYEYSNECYEICPSRYYNYTHTGCIDTIPQGFYCNDTSKKTIDKCDIKCRQCSKESVQKKLCDSCNNDEGYYQKYNDPINIDGYINCYNDIPEGYHLDINNMYMPCYKTCKTCDETGIITNHKCTSCYSNSTFNDSNCYEICQHHYYFDKTKEYHCTEDDNCPNEYNKLIIEKNECVKKCVNEYKYEFDNICYKSCPEGTYYNYEHTSCINQIPLGFYCNNTNEQTIDKCDKKCEKCDLISSNKELCISCNNSDNYYPKENHYKDDYVNCYNKEIDGYYFDNSNKIYKQCYKTCKYCIELGSVETHKCTACYSNSTFNNSNCYEICPFFYYFDETKEYHCTIDDNCPISFPKKIIEKKKCIANCYNDDYFKLEYNNICYNSCPKRTKKKENYDLCEDLSCIYLYNYEQNECLEVLPAGFYVNDTLKKTIDKCNNKCKECSIESNKLNLCILCNTKENYYPKENDMTNENGFVNCYDSLPDGYFFNNSTNSYKSCYKTCKKCNEIGNIYNHKCIECFPTSTLNDSNCYEICNSFHYFDSLNEYHCTQKDECPKGYKLIKEKNKCIDDCEKDDEYKYEYNNKCYQTPVKPKCNNYSLFINKITKECLDECNIFDFFNNICGLRNNNDKNFKDIMIKNIGNEIESGLINYIFKNNYYLGDINDFIIKDNDILYQITSSYNQKHNEYNNISTILFEDCENILKRIYNIEKNQSLIIFKVEYYMNNYLIPIIGYELFHPINNSKLNLKYCDDELININIPVVIDEKHLDKYDPNSDYYLNDCYPYTKNNRADILLKDRQDEYNKNNFAICESNCTFKNYKINSKKSVCFCQIKSEQIEISKIDNQAHLLSNEFKIDEGFFSSLSTLKCYYTLFSSNGLIKNIAFYLSLLIFVFMITLIGYFYKIGYNSLIIRIENLLLEKEKTNKNNSNNISQKEKKNNIFNVRSIKNIKNKDNTLKKQNLKFKQLPVVINKELIGKEDINASDNFSSSNQRSSIKMDMIYSKKTNNININKIKSNDNMNYYDYELNSFSYEFAIKYDKRPYYKYYISLIKTKHPIIFSFLNTKDYNSMIIKIFLFLLSFCIYYFINCLFITKSTIHKIYEEDGNYNIRYFTPFIIYSFIISHFLISVIKYLSLSQRNILDIKNEENIEKAKEKTIEIKKLLAIKYTIFFSISCAFVLFNGYYLSSFGAIYQNTQIILITNVLISFGISFIYPFIINLLPGLFRIYSLKNARRRCLYNFSKFIQVL